MGLEYLKEQKARAKQGPQSTHRPEGNGLRAASRVEAEKFWRNLEAYGMKVETWKKAAQETVESSAGKIDPATGEGMFAVFTGKDEPADNNFMRGKVAAMRTLAYEMGYEITGLIPDFNAGTARGRIRRIAN